MDNFAEQLVKRNETSSDKTRKNALLVIGILITVCLAAFALLQLGNPLRAFFGLLLAAASGYGTFSCTAIPMWSMNTHSPTVNLISTR